MEKIDEEKPKPQAVAAAAAPPHPTATSDGATPPAAKEGLVKFTLRNLIYMFTCIILFFVRKTIYLGFRLDSVSVSIHGDPNITAVWDLSFSTKPEVRDLNVSARFMSRDFQLETVGVNVNRNSTVSISLPCDFVVPKSGGLMLENVVFECNHVFRYGVKAVCENVTVEFLSDDRTKGIMKGGSISCPIVRYGDVTAAAESHVQKHGSLKFL